MQPSPSISFSFVIDDDRQVVRVTSVGTWTLEQVDAYAAEFRHSCSIARERFGRVRALVDGREAMTPDAEVGKRLALLSSLFDQPGDRFAVVTHSSLRKQQASRDGLPDAGMAFVSPDAAEMWLFAHD
jgi:hypothetical protein